MGAPGVWPSIFGLGAKQFNGFRMCSGFRLVSGFGCQLLWFRGVLVHCCLSSEWVIDCCYVSLIVVVCIVLVQRANRPGQAGDTS